MAIPSSGTLSLNGNICGEFGGPKSLKSHYRDAGYVTSNNTNVPTSGTISIKQFYGATLYVPGYTGWGSPGNYSMTVPAGVSTVYIHACAGGGGGGGLGPNPGGINYGGGGGGGGCIAYPIGVNPGDTISCSIGGGGVPQWQNPITGQVWVEDKFGGYWQTQTTYPGGTAGGNTYIYRNGTLYIGLGGGGGGYAWAGGAGGSGPSYGSSGYIWGGGPSGAVSSGWIGWAYGVGGYAGSDYGAIGGQSGAVFVIW